MNKTLIALALLLSAPTFSADWHTIHTEHFNVHYSTEHIDFAKSTAVELEIVRIKVLEQQNRALDETVDVVVFDPLNAANGFALPTSNNPIMALFTTPPQSDTVISNSTGWQQLLVLHEYIHLVHLAQPTRSEWRQKIRSAWDVFDLTYSNMPRWVAEGYATLIESKMTGRGRLFDNYSESMLVEFAQQGALPTYNQLNDSQAFMGGSMAYLMGSRFLYWLEQRYSEQTLDAVWTRMQAVKTRNFDAAFHGVFGQRAATLYARFIAEYTYKAMAKEHLETALDSSLWLKLGFYASNPALSNDGSKLAIVERDTNQKTSLIIYSTEPNVNAEKAFEKSQKELLKNDPQDIPDTPPEVFKREKKQVLNQINHAGIANPQWVNSSTLYFNAYSNEGSGAYNKVSDIYRYNIDSGKVEQLTKLAGIRRFTVSNDGETLYAEQIRNGYSELVKLDLNTQVITPLFTHSLKTAYDYPTFSPDESKLAYLSASLNENWQLYIKNVDDGSSQVVPMPNGYQYLSQPSFSQNGESIYFVAGLNSATDVYRYHMTSKTLTKLTHGQEAVAHPIEMRDGSLLYLSITADGPNVKQLPNTLKGSVVTDLALTKAAPLRMVNTHTLPKADIYTREVGLDSNYNVFDQQATFAVSSQYYSASTAVLDLSIKSSDVLKHLDLQAGYSVDLHDSALQGGFLNAKYSALPIKLKLNLFDYNLSTARQYQDDVNLSADIDTRGVFAAMRYPLKFGHLNITPELAYNYTQYASDARKWARIGVSQSWQYDQQAFAIGQRIGMRYYDGSNKINNWQGIDIVAKLFGKAFDIPLYVDFEQKQRDDYSLALGGFSSNLINQDQNSEFVLASELPFYSATAERYQGYGGGFSLAEGMPWVYYKQYQLDDIVYGQSYGVKYKGDFNFGMGPAGINDLTFNMGLSRIEGDSFENDTRAWLSFYYSL
jgi:Tol biopolymer transport system component